MSVVSNSIYIDSDYVYNTLSGTLFIYDATTQQEIAEVLYPYTITSIYSNDYYVFLGTLNSGVETFNKSILTTFINPTDIFDATYSYKTYPDITGNQIRMINGVSEYISICTSSGIDFFKLEPYGYRSYHTDPDIYACFLLNSRELYYTVSGTQWSLCKVDPIVNWSSNTVLYTTGDSILDSCYTIGSLYVTSQTNDYLYNTIFITTDIGAYIINEFNNEFKVITISN